MISGKRLQQSCWWNVFYYSCKNVFHFRKEHCIGGDELKSIQNEFTVELKRTISLLFVVAWSYF